MDGQIGWFELKVATVRNLAAKKYERIDKGLTVYRKKLILQNIPRR
jgi:hypothetical protein